jgi:hypothetical protein
MTWWQERKPPFSAAKPKEFPDAVAFATLRNFADEREVAIAVVSGDGDFKEACLLHPPAKGALVYYASLEALLEPFLEHERRFEAGRALLAAAKERIRKEADAEFENLWFDYAHAHDADVHNAYATEVAISDIAIIDVDDDGFDVSFSAEIKFAAGIVITDWDTAIGDSEDGYHPWRKFRGTIRDETTLTGATRVLVDDGWTKLLDIEDFGFDETRVTVRAQPDYDNDDEDERERLAEEDLGPGPRH